MNGICGEYLKYSQTNKHAAHFDPRACLFFCKEKPAYAEHEKHGNFASRIFARSPPDGRARYKLCLYISERRNSTRACYARRAVPTDHQNTLKVMNDFQGISVSQLQTKSKRENSNRIISESKSHRQCSFPEPRGRTYPPRPCSSHRGSGIPHRRYSRRYRPCPR